MPPLPKACPKTGFCPKKGVAFLTEDVFEKKFQVRERIPLSALAPARRAAAASEPKAPPCPLNRQSTPRSTAMLAEIYLPMLEAARRLWPVCC